MDALIVSELDKIIASLEVIENQLERMDPEQDGEYQIRSVFPPLPFPAFEEGSGSLPI